MNDRDKLLVAVVIVVVLFILLFFVNRNNDPDLEESDSEIDEMREELDMLRSRVDELEDRVDELEDDVGFIAPFRFTTTGANNATGGSPSGGPFAGWFTSPATSTAAAKIGRIRVTWGGRGGQQDPAVEHSLGALGQFEATLLFNGSPAWSSGAITQADEDQTTTSAANYGGGGLGVGHYFKDFIVDLDLPEATTFGSSFTWSDVDPEFKAFFIEVYNL